MVQGRYAQESDGPAVEFVLAGTEQVQEDINYWFVLYKYIFFDQ